MASPNRSANLSVATAYTNTWYDLNWFGTIEPKQSMAKLGTLAANPTHIATSGHAQNVPSFFSMTQGWQAIHFTIRTMGGVYFFSNEETITNGHSRLCIIFCSHLFQRPIVCHILSCFITYESKSDSDNLITGNRKIFRKERHVSTISLGDSPACGRLMP